MKNTDPYQLYSDYNELYSDYIDYKSLHFAQIAFAECEFEISKALFEKAWNKLLQYDGDRWYYISYSGYISDWLEKTDDNLADIQPNKLGRLIRNWLVIRLALHKPEWVLPSNIW